MEQTNIYDTIKEKFEYYNNDLVELIGIDLSCAKLSELAIETLRTFANFKDLIDCVSSNISNISENDKKAITLRINSHKSMINVFFGKVEEQIKKLEVLGSIKRSDRPFALEVSNNLNHYKSYLETPTEILISSGSGEESTTPPQPGGEDQ